MCFQQKIKQVQTRTCQKTRLRFFSINTPEDVALDSDHLYPAETHTDSNGIAEVTVKVPEDIHNGKSIEVKATTKSVWPQLYMDLNDNDRQDLLGTETCFELTVSTNVYVLAYILVIPEVPLGILIAGAACAFAFMFWKRGGHLKKQDTLRLSQPYFPFFIKTTHFFHRSEILLGILK
jgi:hypothetical protein